VACLIPELIEKHDREQFMVVAYSYGPDDGSATRARLVKAFDRFVDLTELSPVDVARRIQADGVDILVDLKGYTRHARTQILAPRPAPVQVNYLGYPGTSGLSADGGFCGSQNGQHGAVQSSQRIIGRRLVSVNVTQLYLRADLASDFLQHRSVDQLQRDGFVVGKAWDGDGGTGGARPDSGTAGGGWMPRNWRKYGDGWAGPSPGLTRAPGIGGGA
jgi:hypothetical protein